MRREARTEAESWEAEAEAETRAESWEAEAETRAESWEAEAETRAEAEAAPAAAAAAEASAGAAAKEALEEGRRRAGGRRSACVFCVWEQTASLAGSVPRAWRPHSSGLLWLWARASAVNGAVFFFITRTTQGPKSSPSNLSIYTSALVSSPSLAVLHLPT